MTKIGIGGIFFIFCLTVAGLVQANPDPYFKEREHMVNFQIKRRGITNPGVIEAMMKVKRHLFLPEENREYAYVDSPFPIGHGQTISQPYIVALMTQLLEVKPEHKILEIGTGSGYQAAILGELASQVYTIEIVKELGLQAKNLLAKLGYKNVHVKVGDGYQGWPEHALFDGIIVTAAPDHIPPPLIEQLKIGGRLVIPVGKPKDVQHLILAEKQPDGSLLKKDTLPVRFVPFTGDH